MDVEVEYRNPPTGDLADMARIIEQAAASGPDGVTAFSKQDSSLLSVLSDADCLIVQPPHDPARDAGEMVEIISL